jgi:sulfonate transport system ATP-binding protein
MRHMHSSEFDLAPWGAVASLREWLGPAPADERVQPVSLAVTREAGSPGLTVTVKGLSKRYGERQVLHDVDLSIAPGEFVAIVGRSGCGKSTLLRQMAGLESADAGEVRLGGRPVDQGLDSLRIMYQDARLLPWKSVLDNVGLGLTGSSARALAHEALAEVGLVERGFDWPSVLSGGQRQRVALARALVHRPRLLLLDEPLGALDALTRIEMQRLIERLWQRHGFTALLVTHDVAEAVTLADRVVLIEEQRIAFDERVGLVRPRSRAAAGFAALEDRVLRRVLRHPPAIEERPAPEPLPPGLRFAI